MLTWQKVILVDLSWCKWKVNNTQSLSIFQCWLSENCNNLNSLRTAIDTDDLKTELAESLSPCREMVSDLMKRLELKGQSFEVFEPAATGEVNELWSNIILAVDETLQVWDEFNLTFQLKFLNGCTLYCIIYCPDNLGKWLVCDI